MVKNYYKNNDLSRNDRKYIGIAKYQRIILVLALFSAFVGHSTLLDYLVATVWMACALFLFNKEDFWVLFIPLSLFENTIFFYFTEYTVFKILLLIAIAKMLLSLIWSGKLRLNRYMLISLILFAYVLMNLGEFLPGKISMVICILTVFMMCYSTYKMRDCEFFKRAMFGFALFAVAAGIYGVLHGNTMVITQNGETMMRFCGTSADPNIMGYGFVIGFIALYYTDLIKSKALKLLMGLFLAIMIFRTGSTTALLALGVFIALSVILQRMSVKKTLAIMLGTVSVMLLLLNIEAVLTFIDNTNFLGIEGGRLLSQYYSFVGGDISEATTYRTEIWDGYMDYFWNQQGAVAQLFGGNVSNVYGIEKNFAGMSWLHAAHNTNIDMLMSIGIVGTVIIYLISLKGLIEDVKLYRREHGSVVAMKISVKLMTVFYTFSLSSFLSYGYMIFLM